MDLRSLECFIAVAEELHFRRAAERLYMSQSAVSQQIKQLEVGWGIRLLERSTRNVRLTADGTALLTEARRVVNEAHHMDTVLRRLREGADGVLGVGYLIANPDLAPALVEAFRREFRSVRVVPVLRYSSENVEALRRCETDVAFVRSFSSLPDDLASVSVEEEELGLVLPAGHPLALLEEVPASRLAGQRLVLPPFKSIPGLHERILAVLNGEVALDEASEEGVFRAVERGAGIGVTRRSIPPDSGVVIRSISGRPLWATLHLAWRRGDTSVLVSNFVELVKSQTVRLENAN